MKKKINFNILCMMCVFSLFLVLNININLTGFGDDSILFLDPLLTKFNGNELAFLADRYTHWSSRIVIEIFTLLSVQNHIIWKLLNTLAMTTIALSPIYIFNLNKDKINMVTASTSLFLMLPISMFAETGWIATTTNYLWVLACFFAFLVIVSTYYRTKKVNLLSYLFSLLLVLYASNLEQMCVVLIVSIPALAYYFYLNNRKYMFLIPHFVITVFNLLFIVFSPGNKTRYAKEVAHWFPDYDSLSFFRKIELGFSSTFKTLFFNSQFIFLVLAIVLFCVFYNSKNAIFTSIGTFPIVIYLLFNTFYQNVSDRLPVIKKIMESFNQYGTSFQLSQPKTWITDILILSLIFCIVASICYVFKDEKLKIILIVSILSLGFLTKFMMAFSPTIWASGSRTNMFLFTSVIISILFLLNESNNSKWLFGLINSVGFVCFLNFIVNT